MTDIHNCICGTEVLVKSKSNSLLGIVYSIECANCSLFHCTFMSKHEAINFWNDMISKNAILPIHDCTCGATACLISLDYGNIFRVKCNSHCLYTGDFRSANEAIYHWNTVIINVDLKRNYNV